MDLILRSVKIGFIKAMETTLMLMKVVLPVYAIVVIIKHSPLMGYFQKAFEPVMAFFKLPSEAAVPLIAGLFTDEYGMIAVSYQFEFTSWELTTIAMVGLACHSIPMEYVLSKKIGLPAGKFVLYRVFAAIVIGFIVAQIGRFFY